MLYVHMHMGSRNFEDESILVSPPPPNFGDLSPCPPGSTPMFRKKRLIFIYLFITPAMEFMFLLFSVCLSAG